MLEVVILAAGEGKRMRSAQPKVLQPVGGQAMLGHLLEAVAALSPNQVHVVIGQGAEAVRAEFPAFQGQWVQQTERLGTGHATLQAIPHIDPAARVLVLPADMPLVRSATLQALVDEPADLSVLTFMADDPTGYGRILRDAQDRVIDIREQADASAQEVMIKEVNSGVLVAHAQDLKRWLEGLVPQNAQGEYYLTDCIALAASEGKRLSGVIAEDSRELMGANDRAQLAILEAVWQARCRHELLMQGAILQDARSVYIQGSVKVGQDVIIGPNVYFYGDVELGDGVSIGPGCVVTNSQLAAGTILNPYSVLEGVTTTGAATIGPFARLRPETKLAEGVKVGNFVEIKKSSLGKDAKAGHLTYLGDTTVGEAVNIGAGTITCNYDGVNKHATTIGAGAFVGSNTSLVAPVHVGENATIGAGSVISKDVEKDQLSLTRAPQKALSGWKRPTKNKEGEG